MKKATFFNTIYLSPHLDDAVLSCGGQMYQQSKVGKKILIVTIMGGDPGDAPISDFARSLHDRWQFDSDIVEARRIEDQAACLALGTAYEHWPIPDCIYRTYPQDGKPLYPSEESIFSDVHPYEAALVSDLSERLAQLPAYDRVIIPLGVGHHVDHQLTRLAAETGIPANRLTYYEDYPYSMDETAVKRLLMTPDSWHPHIVALSEHELEVKIQAIACYHSQLGTFFDSLQDMTRQVGRYSNSIGGERLWSANEPFRGGRNKNSP